MSKFKVDDRVRVLDNMTRSGSPIKEYDVGSVYAIERVCGDGEGGVGYLFNGHYQYLRAAQIQLAPKFAVGDKVRVVKTGEYGSYHGAKIGEEFTVKHIYDKSVGTNSWDFYEHEIEPVAVAPGTPTYTSCAAAEVDNLADEYGGRKAKFKVGDRVVCTDEYAGGGYTYGKEYTVSRCYRGDFGEPRIGTEADDEGDSDNGWGVENFELAPATATPLTIQAGRYYKTRDGRRVGPVVSTAYDHCRWSDAVKWCHGTSGWYEKGNYWTDEEHPNDLVAEWSDDDVPLRGVSPIEKPVVAPATTAEPDSKLLVTISADTSELDAEIDRVKRRLKKLAKRARKLGIDLEFSDLRDAA